MANEETSCDTWKREAETALFHIGCVACLLAMFGGSNTYSLIYSSTLLCIAFLGWMFWWWFEVCALEGVIWSAVLGFLCIIQVAHAYLLLRRARRPLPPEMKELYEKLFQPLGLTPSDFRKLAKAGPALGSGTRPGKDQGGLWVLAPGEAYAIETKTPVNWLSVLLSGSARVTSGERFLHTVESLQFLDSPEWESLNPEEMATFQVTITADQPCKVASWPLSQLRALLTQDSLLSNIMGVLTGHDVADKLSAVHTQAWASASPDPLGPGAREMAQTIPPDIRLSCLELLMDRNLLGVAPPLLLPVAKQHLPFQRFPANQPPSLGSQPPPAEVQRPHETRPPYEETHKRVGLAPLVSPHTPHL
uniref:popeye domain-containing protein 3 isoform X2 n=1 Tax=Myxine glutinosa TaxID=7769 RepID=UPI00358FAE49